MILFIVSFVAGALTVLAPCILPLLPVIVGGSLSATGGTASRSKVFIIVTSLGVSVIVFTLLLKLSSVLIAIPPLFWTWLSGGIVFFIGLTFLLPGLWEQVPFLSRVSIGSNKLVSAGYRRKGIVGDVIIGAALGPVFSTCSPTYFIVLATVLPVQPLLGLVYLFAYTFGLCLMLLLVGLLGQRFADRLGFAADPQGKFKRILGVVFIIVGLVIVTGTDKLIQIKLLEWGIFDVTKVEELLLRATGPNSSKGAATTEGLGQTVLDGAMRVARKEGLYQKAPEIQNAAGYINTGFNPDGSPKGITIGEFKGKKVVLLDIWTYSCINCQRTIPYLKAWNAKYGDQGLEIIGIHTPEFAFEKDIENVSWAVKQFGLTYPQVLDNDYATWRALGNNYWPRKYLIDIDGYIVYDHAGEGGYEEFEAAIQRALMERAMVVGAEAPDDSVVAKIIPSANLNGINSPEIYFGASRNRELGNGSPGSEGVQDFAVPNTVSRNVLYLYGRWNITPEYAESEKGAGVIFKYSAKDVYMVASASSPTRVRVLRDGQPVAGFAGADVDKNGYVTIKANRLYKLVHDENPGEHTLRLEIESPGLQVYAFTFG